MLLVLMALWVLLASACLSLGWSVINGQHRRNQKYKSHVIESATKFPPQTKRKLLRLVAPTHLNDRINHAMVIAGCCVIITSPAIVALMIWSPLLWWQPLPLAVGGTLFGAFIGEFLINSWGCEVNLPDEPTEH